MTEEILGRLPEGERYFSAGSLAQLPIFFFFSLSEFPSEKIETGHAGETDAIKSEIAVSVP